MNALAALVKFAGRDLGDPTLKTLLDNVRNYTLSALLLKGGATLLGRGGFDTVTATLVLAFGVVLTLATYFQTVALLSSVVEEVEEAAKTPLDAFPEWDALKFVLRGLICALFGSSIVYVLFQTLPL